MIITTEIVNWKMTNDFLKERSNLLLSFKPFSNKTGLNRESINAG